MSDRLPGFNTLAIHAGAAPDAATGARATPIYQTTSFVFYDVDHAASLFGLQAFGNIYTRITNPTNAVLEERIAALEGGTAALAVASGHAAEFLTMHALMQPGDEFVASNKLYGGSINQFNHSYKNFGWSVAWADNDDPASFEAAITPRTKAIFCESIANPGGVITDLAALSQIAKRHNIPLVVDNTMATPYLIRPFEHGADIVVHSATKFLGGHGNSIGGLIVDGGRGADGGPPPVIARLPYPEAWRIVLILDPSMAGVHGTREVEAFRDLPRWHFVALGPALSRRPLTIAVGPTQTVSRSSSPVLVPLPDALEDARALILTASPAETVAPLAPRPKPRPTPAPDVLVQLANYRPPAPAEEPEEEPMDPEAREAALAEVLASVLADADAAACTPATLYQDFTVRCRIRRLRGYTMGLP